MYFLMFKILPGRCPMWDPGVLSCPTRDSSVRSETNELVYRVE